MSTRSRQLPLIRQSSLHRFSHGGELRRKRAGRGARPLSTREPLHLVFKCDRYPLRRGGLRGPTAYLLCRQVVKRYAKRFFIKVEQMSVQGDHIHLLIRTARRSHYQHFFRVVAGQIAQNFGKYGLFRVTGTPERSGDRCVTGTPGGQSRLWLHRPFTRVVRGYRPWLLVRDYITLNEMEARGVRAYRKDRLRGMSTAEKMQLLLWAGASLVNRL